MLFTSATSERMSGYLAALLPMDGGVLVCYERDSGTRWKLWGVSGELCDSFAGGTGTVLKQVVGASTLRRGE